MKKLTKVLALAIVAIMLCSLCPFTISAAGEDFDKWDGTADVTWFNADTKEYEIDSAKKLAGLAQLSATNKLADYSFYITKNMDLSGHEWVAIGPKYEQTFDGYIEGKLGGEAGKAITIKGMTITNVPNANYGFVGTQSGGGLKNLTFVDCNIKSGADTVGIALGYARKTASVYENLIVVNSTVNSTGNQYTGGVIGYEKSTNESITFKNLAFIGGSVTGTGKYTGGVIGCAHNSPANFENLYCSGIVSSIGSMVGGLVGGSYDAKTRTFKNCQFDGVVNGATAIDTGAMIGNVHTGDGIKITFENCVNTGISRALSGTSSARGSAWIGMLNGKNTIELTATNCYDNSPATYMVGTNESTESAYTTLKPTLVTLDQVSTAEKAIANMTGLDFVNVWEPRAEMTPVLALVKDYEAGKYAKADLSWFDSDADKEYSIENENQLLGLALLSHACNPTKFNFKVDAALQSLMTEELFAKKFLDKFEVEAVVTTETPVVETTPAEIENTTPAEVENTTPGEVEQTNPSGGETTTAPVKNDQGGCGGIAIVAQLVALVCAAAAVVVIKKK